MLKTQEIDIRSIIEQAEEPLLGFETLENEEDPADYFDGVCVQHDGCRSIL
ncbi:hypothetical protein [Salinibacterium sp. ZJ77]|uniref:hypothetical protein n=1 Tax=Salinibacterium sp. ZJ77 TaxID=2708337 RepID=UPI001420B58F|nr:hypothetical protein [Salinibacterium sp. ZJ77]